MPRPRLSPERRHTLCASPRSRNACQDFTRVTLSGNLQDKCRSPDWAQNADTHFVRACAVETHVKISQEQLYAEIYRKNAATQLSHKRDPRFVRACAIEMHMQHFTRDIRRATEIYRKNAAPQIEAGTQTDTLCEPAQSKRMSRFHKSHVIRKFTGQMPRPSWIPQAGPALCASLRDRNACNILQETSEEPL